MALTDEDRFLRVVGSTFLEVGQLADVWDHRPHGFRDEHPEDVRRRPSVLPVSLTQQLDDPGSPMSTFMVAELPNVKAVLAEYRRQLPQSPPLRPKWPVEAGPVPWGTLGLALDARLRLTLSPDAGTAPGRTGPVWEGIQWLRSRPDLSAVGDSAREVAAATAELVARCTPHTRRGLLLPSVDEDALCRQLIVLAWCEEIFRTRRLAPGSALDRLSTSGATSAADLAAAVPAEAVADVVGILGLCGLQPDWVEVRKRARAVPGSVVSGPAFAGSSLVGGADADVVVGGLLLDIKAAVNPRAFRREIPYQLIGYVLLDLDDAFAMTSAGLFLARQGALVRWELPELLRLFGAQRPLPELRERCRQHLQASKFLRASRR